MADYEYNLLISLNVYCSANNQFLINWISVEGRKQRLKRLFLYFSEHVESICIIKQFAGLFLIRRLIRRYVGKRQWRVAQQ
jgi:hypothetical protein